MTLPALLVATLAAMAGNVLALLSGTPVFAFPITKGSLEGFEAGFEELLSC